MDGELKIAKSRREVEMDKIRLKYGNEVGSGYPSDPLTVEFLKKNANKYSEDGIFRRTWKTWQKAASLTKQKKLNF